MKFTVFSIAIAWIFATHLSVAQTIFHVDEAGMQANSEENATPKWQNLIRKIKREQAAGKSTVLRFSKGRYHFYPQGAEQRRYFISNHDQGGTKQVGIALEDMKNFTLDGQGAELIFHGKMLPISLLRSQNCTLQNFAVDFADPRVLQVKVVDNLGEKGLVVQIPSWVNYSIHNQQVQISGENWTVTPNIATAFEAETKRIVYRSGDVAVETRGAVEIAPRRLRLPNVRNSRLIPGTMLCLRSWDRPAPAIFLENDENIKLHGVKIHYAEGMGLLAQGCDTITLDGFSVCLRGKDDPRYFTTQADATHFSGCRGKISVTHGLFENMYDDAINVHGTYLKIVKRLDDRRLIGRFMHDQSYGFEWGRVGDEVQWVKAKTMNLLPGTNRITSILPHQQQTVNGAREFLIQFRDAISPEVTENEVVGMENLTWTPQLYFAHNLVRNNRARGSLLSTPRTAIVEHNVFDHTSGSAILLCGDCNGWFETGACREVVIRNNRFINALTSEYQFTHAVISICPEIPNLLGQTTYFHRGVRIENNEFDMFDQPVLYAKSVDGLIFRGNTIKRNQEYPPFHPNQERFKFERVIHVDVTE